MSFRKRNVVISQPGALPSQDSKVAEPVKSPGVRPSPLDGRLTTSTGTRSLDALLAGHAGLPLGNSLLIEESGTTDFGGALLRFCAAEGVAQGHQVHVLGLDEAWGRELPGLAVGSDQKSSGHDANPGDKMKIAWRYEKLGDFGRDRSQSLSPSNAQNSNTSATFCHDFDLSKRLTVPTSLLRCVPLPPPSRADFGPIYNSVSPFAGILQYLSSQLSASQPTTIHRILIPNILSPAIYSQTGSTPSSILQFMHALRGLLRNYSSQVVVLITLPLSLYPRSSGLARWMEMLSDGVLELAPFPANTAVLTTPNASLSAAGNEEPPQGLLNVHRLPVFHEKGGGGGGPTGLGDDMAFTMSKKRGLVIKPYSLPPLESDSEGQQDGLQTDRGGTATKVDIEF